VRLAPSYGASNETWKPLHRFPCLPLSDLNQSRESWLPIRPRCWRSEGHLNRQALNSSMRTAEARGCGYGSANRRKLRIPLQAARSHACLVARACKPNKPNELIFSRPSPKTGRRYKANPAADSRFAGRRVQMRMGVTPRDAGYRSALRKTLRSVKQLRHGRIIHDRSH
jgi:hypothetical protein